MTRIHIDLETRSTADLRKVGVFVYAADPTTDVWCACWAVDDGPVEVWLPGEPCPAAIVAGALGEAVFVAHNAGFERTLWAGVLEPRHGWPPVPALERWDCTAARAAAMALPRSLDGAAEALGLPVRKDEEGGRLMLRMARPRSVEPDGTAVWWTDKARLDRLIAYCRRDVEVEHALDKALRPLGAHEREIWLLDQRINERGIAVDLEFVARSGEVVEQAKVAAGRELRRITEGAVPSCTARPQMVAWLAKQGVPVDSIDKAALAGLVVREDLDDRVLEALVLWAETAKTSTAKLPTLAKRTSKDGRLRGGLLYHGASTGRWAGIGFQPQNLPRSILKQTDIEWAIAEMRAGATASTVGAMLGPPLSVVSDCIRGCIVAGKGKSLVVADFKSIEGRVIAWLAGEKWVLDAYRKGADLYCLDAESIYGYRIDPKIHKAERQIGKTANLALGFAGGKGAFAKMAAKMGVVVTEERAEEIKIAWRAAHPATVRFWWDMSRAAMGAVESPGAITTVGKLRFRVKGGFLWMILPNGRPLAYCKPRIEDAEMPWGELRPVVTFMGTNSLTKQWQRQVLSPMVLAENPVQAVARDLMAEAMLRVEAAGYPVVMTVHDEIVCERESKVCDFGEFERIMVTSPAWAAGCPIEVEGWVGSRYRK